MSYRIVIPKPAQKQLDNITKIERDRLIETLRSLANDPRPNGVKKLKGYNNTYRVRVGALVPYREEKKVLLTHVTQIERGEI